MEINLPSGLTKECDFLSVVVVVALAAPESRNMRFAVRSQLTLRAMLPSSRWKSEIYRARDWDTNKSQEFHSPFSDIKLILVLHFSLPFLGLLKSASNDFYSNSRGKIKERGDGKEERNFIFWFIGDMLWEFAFWSRRVERHSKGISLKLKWTLQFGWARGGNYWSVGERW